MGGEVIQALRASLLASSLTEAEIQALANCGRIHRYETGEPILQAGSYDERLFILRRGRVLLHLSMQTTRGQCGGEATRALTLPGQAFGWGTWIRAENITVSAYALEPASLVALDLGRLKDSEIFWKLSRHMLRDLYGWLQETGLCPPNIQVLLRMDDIS